MKRSPRIVSREDITQTVQYCAETGIFYALDRRRGAEIGEPVGYVSPTGYVYLSIKNIRMLAHRVAWFLQHNEWPLVIDHINGNPGDNRISNLRSTNQTFNRANSRVGISNSTGFKGVTWCKRGKCYRAQICINRRNKFLGHFKTPEEAHKAYLRAAQELFGEFARAA